MSRETAIIFDDGSLETKVLQFELKTSYDLKVVPVKPYTDLDIWLAEVIDETDDIQKIFLHFPIEDYIQKSIRDEIMAAHRNYPKLRIIAWYEQAPRSNIQHRAANYGIKLDVNESIPVSDVSYEDAKNIASDIIREIDERKPYVSQTSDDFKKTLTKKRNKRLPFSQAEAYEA